MSLLLFGKNYLDKALSVEPANLIGLWLQNEASGAVSVDSSGHAHHGAYTGVTLGQPGVPGMGYTCPFYDGLNDYNNIYSAGLANDNLLANGGFETAGAGGADIWANWSETVGAGAALANETVLVHEGADAAKMTQGAASAYVSQSITIIPGKKYRVRFYTRGDGTHGGRYQLWDAVNGAYIISQTATGVTGATYTAIVKECTAPAGCTTAILSLISPTTAGGICYFDACEIRCMDGFLGDEGTLLAWAKVANAGVWTDGVARFIVQMFVDVQNYVRLYKPTINNLLLVDYEAGDVYEQGGGAFTGTDWFCLGASWSKSGDVISYYKDGAAFGGADTVLGTWVGDIAATYAVIGAAVTTPTAVWSGDIGPVALWNQALTADQIAYLSTV